MKRKIEKFLMKKQHAIDEMHIAYTEDGRFDFLGDLEGVLSAVRGGSNENGRRGRRGGNKSKKKNVHSSNSTVETVSKKRSAEENNNNVTSTEKNKKRRLPTSADKKTPNKDDPYQPLLIQNSSSMTSSYLSQPHKSLLSFDDEDLNTNNVANIFTFSPTSKQQPFSFTEASSFDSKNKFDGLFSTRNSNNFIRGLTPLADVIKDPWVLSSRNNSSDDDDAFNIMNPFNGHDLKSIFSPTVADKSFSGDVLNESMNARKRPRLCISHVTIGTSSNEECKESMTTTQVVISPINTTNKDTVRSRSLSIDRHITNQKSPLKRSAKRSDDSITQVSISDVECNSNTTTASTTNNIMLNRTFSTASTASSNNHNLTTIDSANNSKVKTTLPPPIISDSRDSNISTSTVASSINPNNDMIAYNITKTEKSPKELPQLELSLSSDKLFENNNLAISTTNSEASAERFWATCASGISFDFSPTNNTKATPINKKKKITSISPHSNHSDDRLDEFYDDKGTSSFSLNF